MKNMMAGLILCVLAFTGSAVYGAQKGRGVYGIDVIVKQDRTKRAMTDADGHFTLEALPPGSYTLSFRAKRAKDLAVWDRFTSDKVVVATSYAIKVEGAKKPVHLSNLSTNQLLAGVNIAVEVGSGAEVRGEVSPASHKKWVWIPHETGSHIPGRWEEEGSKKAAGHNTVVYKPSSFIYR